MGASLLFARHARKFNGNIRRSACHGPTTGRLLGSSRANPFRDKRCSWPNHCRPCFRRVPLPPLPATAY
jgi:hypothetical protein